MWFDTDNPVALEPALILYDGKAFIKLINGKEKSLSDVLPLAKEHSAVVIGFCMDDNGIPAIAEERAVVAEEIARAAQTGIPTEDVIIDPLAMSKCADSRANRVTLDTIHLVVREFWVNIIMGASNVSFDLPDRKLINTAFMTMAIQVGLTCPITKPLVTEINTAVLAADLAIGKDDICMHWVPAYS